MQCKMCNTSYCSCKSACPSCHLDNSIVYFINDVIKDWLTPAQAKENKTKFKDYYKKIDSYSLMEYLSWAMDEEHFQEALKNYVETKQTNNRRWEIDTIKVSWQPNPNQMCEIIGDKIWWRCKYCGQIWRYSKWKQCPMYWITPKNEEENKENISENNETLGSTVS